MQRWLIATVGALVRAPAAAAGLLAAAALLTSCGGGGSSSSTSVSTGKAALPRAAFHCLEDAGLKVKSSPPNSDTVISNLVVDPGRPDQVLVWFLDSRSSARRYAENAASFLANSSGDAEVIAKTIVIGKSAKTAHDELTQVEDCATS